MTGPIPVTVGPLQPYGNCPQSDNCHEDSGPTINKAIIITRHVGRRHPTTNQRNIKMLEFINDDDDGDHRPHHHHYHRDESDEYAKHPKQTQKTQGGTHTMPQGGRGGTTPSRPTPGPHHTTGPLGGRRGGSAEPGSYMLPNYGIGSQTIILTMGLGTEFHDSGSRGTIQSLNGESGHLLGLCRWRITAWL